MFAKQVSIFVENKKGRLEEVTRVLADAGINIRALSMADMADLGVLRLIVDDRPRCLSVLREHDLVAQETEVIAARMQDRPGGLHRIIEALGGEQMNIEYMYTFLAKDSEGAIVVIKISEPKRAAEVLSKNGIDVLPEDVIQKL